jgi:uncharacterized DUF497 family protein
VFADPLAIIVDDAEQVERSIITGRSTEARILVTVFVEMLRNGDADEDVTRIISARRATRQERRRYEEGET